ncbi:hypothetical protein SAMN05444414_12023 [Roseovarius marisflavi]|uniref:Uncharacterized protein n=1 Tax=Roseovarius marisflavi TaxID=1054996 RepID=A0A1M7BQ88_9RHOB|nr:hypothetical protein SAMN05444414_12023 [Roseovarius marisflavi]
MTNDEREIQRKLRALQYAETVGDASCHQEFTHALDDDASDLCTQTSKL